MCITMNKYKIKINNKTKQSVLLKEIHINLFKKSIIKQQCLSTYPQSTTLYNSYYFFN